jgi:hypothetical protein
LLSIEKSRRTSRLVFFTTCPAEAFTDTFFKELLASSLPLCHFDEAKSADAKQAHNLNTRLKI